MSSIKGQVDFRDFNQEYSDDLRLDFSGYNLFIIFMFVVFFISALGHTINPLDMFFGDGNGRGGILNILSDFGTNFIDWFNVSMNQLKNWGLVDNPNSWISLMGSILSVSAFIINLLLNALYLLLRLMIFVFSGGAVYL